MIPFLSVAIGIGLAVSLLFSEVFGLAAGGMVVPGYFALYLNKPVDVVLTIVAALGTYFIVYMLSSIVIIYGKRRTVMMILVGYMVRMLMDWVPYQRLQGSFNEVGPLASSDWVVIGYIIPGLIAIWMDRQGLIETLSTLLAASVVVRLILIIIFGSEMQTI